MASSNEALLSKLQELALMNELRQKIEVYEMEIEGYKVNISELENHLSGLETTYQMLLERSQYTIQFMRSVFIAVEVLTDCEKTAVLQKVAEGLGECEHWNSAL